MNIGDKVLVNKTGTKGTVSGFSKAGDGMINVSFDGYSRFCYSHELSEILREGVQFSKVTGGFMETVKEAVKIDGWRQDLAEEQLQALDFAGMAANNRCHEEPRLDDKIIYCKYANTLKAMRWELLNQYRVQCVLHEVDTTIHV